jgi:hypothetical protein
VRARNFSSSQHHIAAHFHIFYFITLLAHNMPCSPTNIIQHMCVYIYTINCYITMKTILFTIEMCVQTWNALEGIVYVL